MTFLLSDLLTAAAAARPSASALRQRDVTTRYEELADLVERTAGALVTRGLARSERVAIDLPKQLEFVAAAIGASRAGGVFVPINTSLKPHQVGHILRDCNVRVLVTSSGRLAQAAREVANCPHLREVILTDTVVDCASTNVNILSWLELQQTAQAPRLHRVIDQDMTAILYTSGSTGKPKGVVLSHQNMVTGARSVADYLENTAEDRILAALPFSFDAGFSQLTTAMVAGACTVMMDYLLPRDVLRMLDKERITGLTGVPTLWIQLARLKWPPAIAEHLRYVANTGGAMPLATLAALRAHVPRTRVYLMYGLTEAFRSTYLPPEELDRRVGSIGKAIPNAEVMVVREDGTPCGPGEPGELVHRGALVSLGYWNDPEKTAERFRPAPGQPEGLPLGEHAVWSGDTVKTDEDGFLYFIGRRDEMIKTSGYRVSPTEVEEVLYSSGIVAEAAAVGVPDAQLGQAIVAVCVPSEANSGDAETLLAFCAAKLPPFMLPRRLEWREALPRNPNGKIDRKLIAEQLKNELAESD